MPQSGQTSGQSPVGRCAVVCPLNRVLAGCPGKEQCAAGTGVQGTPPLSWPVATLGSLLLFLLQAHWELISVETTASGFCSEYTLSQ